MKLIFSIFKSVIFPVLFALSAQSAHAQSTAHLAAEVFLTACVKTNNNTQLAGLALIQRHDFRKDTKPRGLFGKQIESSVDGFTHKGGKVSATVYNSRFGSGLCAVGILKPTDLDKTSKTVAQILAQSPLAISPSIAKIKKRKKTFYRIQFQNFDVTVGKSIAGKNVVINILD